MKLNRTSVVFPLDFPRLVRRGTLLKQKWCIKQSEKMQKEVKKKGKRKEI
jgi:hypothetical protein